jgi:16S rRNA (guanine527-N7)-methyltransferase
VSPDAAVALARFAEELTRWGARMNLVGSTEPAALARHFSDSLAGAAHLPQAARVVDLGSGAGFPGIPLAIARPDLDLTLVERREKRLSFLRHAVRELGLRAEVRAASIESAPGTPFAFALLRAVARPEQSARLALPWVHERGEIWIWAGAADRIPGASEIPLASGGHILRIRAHEFSRGTL